MRWLPEKFDMETLRAWCRTEVNNRACISLPPDMLRREFNTSFARGYILALLNVGKITAEQWSDLEAFLSELAGNRQETSSEGRSP
jgi:hypothetical protein